MLFRSSTDTPGVVAPETIRYTLNGSSLASCSDGTAYSTPIVISSTVTLKALVCDQAGNKSGEFSHRYTLDTTPPDPPVITGDAGKYYYNQGFNVQLAAAEAGDILRYSLQTSPGANALNCGNGTTISSGTSIPIPQGVSQGEVQYFYAVSCDLAGNLSTELSRTFIFDDVVPNTPTASDLRGFFNADFNIILSTDTPSPVAPEAIRYSLDGSSLASCLDGALHSFPIVINNTMTVKAIACDQAGNKSGEFSHDYVFDNTPPNPPGITGDAGKQYYSQDFNVQLGVSEAGDLLRYSIHTSPAANTLTCINGNAVTPGANIPIPKGDREGEVQYFYAVSCDLAGNISTEISRSFTFDGLAPNTPTASDLRLFFNADFNITLSTDSPEVTSPETIRYTTDGSSLATCSDGALFSTPITISATTPVKAIACDQAGNKSGEFSHLYTFDTTQIGRAHV